ncbi:MFS transporter [soil metagenome]
MIGGDHRGAMPSDARPTIPRSATIAIATAFFVNGATFSSWIPRLPEIRDRLGVSETGLGITLVGAGVGGLVASVFSGVLVDRFGSRTMTVGTSLLLSALLPLVALASVPAMLFAGLVAIGAADGLTDVSMNSQAVILQRSRPKRLMSRMHGMWSLGMVLGGAVASRAAAAGVTLRTQLLLTSVVLMVVMITLRRWLIFTCGHEHSAAAVVDAPFGDGALRSDDGAGASARPRRRPSTRILARLFVIGAAVTLSEFPGSDWSSVMWSNRFGLSEGQAALGFVSFATGMFVGRFFGDPVVDRLGPHRVKRISGSMAVVGIVVAATAPEPWPLSGLGLFATGLGVSSVFPLVFAASAAMTPGTSRGMSAFSSGTRMGILASAPLIGVISGRATVAIAMMCVVGVAGLVIAVVPLHPPD